MLAVVDATSRLDCQFDHMRPRFNLNNCLFFVVTDSTRKLFLAVQVNLEGLLPLKVFLREIYSDLAFMRKNSCQFEPRMLAIVDAKPEYILVFDLGGGTLDVAILQQNLTPNKRN